MPRLGARFDVIEPEDEVKQKTYLSFFNNGAAEHNQYRKRCEKCFYGGKTQGYNICQYILITGHRRPCPGESKDNKCAAFLNSKGLEKLKAEINERIFTSEIQYNGRNKYWQAK